jgi:hypothetical protein
MVHLRNSVYGSLAKLSLRCEPTNTHPEITTTMNITNQTSDYSILRLRLLLTGLFMLTLISGCAGASSAPTNAVQAGSGTSPTTPTSVSSTPAPQARSVQAAHINAAAFAPNASGQEHLVGIGSATVITVHGSVVKVNRAKKLVTLEGPDGKQITLHVYNPYNLAAAKPGVPFVAKFYEIASIRELQSGETIPAASVAAGIATATAGQVPGAIVGTRRQIVVTVDAVNVDEETVAVKGPDGSVETITVANPADLKYVKVGDQIVLALTNVVAIALEKEPTS